MVKTSLYGAIINMAQTFVGSNNINLLTPNGNFGTRRCGGKDAASPRYIFTQLNKLTSLMFRKEDEAIYTYVEEDGSVVEPETYHPILPFVLVNGVDGIGTGFSTFIPQFNPHELVANLKLMMDDQEPDEMLPWFRGFKGTVTNLGNGKIQTAGIYEVIDEQTVKVTELPIGFWTEDFKEYLDSVTVTNTKENNSKQFIQYFVNNSGNNTVDFTITFADNNLQQFIKSDTLEKKLKLTTSISMNNMYLFNSKGIMTKYIIVDDIMHEFKKTRLSMYKKRKEHHIKVLENELNILREKKRFIQYVITEKIPIKFREETDIEKDLIKHNFKELAYEIGSKPSYGYLTNMRLMSITKTQIDVLEKECIKKEQEYNYYVNKTIKQIWTEELDEFLTEYNKFLADMSNVDVKNSKNNKSKKVTKTKIVKASR